MFSFLNAGTKVALVIGNSNYEIKPLPNAANDAKDIKESLEKIGYDVIFAPNLTKKGFENALYQFKKKATKSDIAVFFYAGHAIQIQEENYLNPIDINIIRTTAEISNLIKLSDIIQEVKVAKNFSAIFIDACRENPLANKLPQDMQKTRTNKKTRGLVQVRTPSKSNMIISFATEAGEVAFDGDGDNSPYSLALKKFITNNQDIRFMIGKVRDNVMASTKNYQIQQIPTTYGTLGGEQYCLTESCSETNFVPLGVTVIGNIMYETKPSREKFSWKEAKEYCKIKRLGEYTDWKLPNQDELKSIANIELFVKKASTKKEVWEEWVKNKQKSHLKNNQGNSYFLQPEFIENIPHENGDFWTSDSKSNEKSWAISFKDGVIATDLKSRKKHILCSRLEEKESFFWNLLN